ncbi:MAG: hypothetical protein RR846_09675 [Oscillospiraceae bacterium]
MNIKNPYVIDVDSMTLDNFIPSDEGELPFEFSKTKLWTESFFEGENPPPPYGELLSELQAIRELTADIQSLLHKVFKD